MAVHVPTFPAGGPAAPAHPLTSPGARTSRRILVDRLARRLVSLGGVAIIASILAILFVIAIEVYPLFGRPTATLVGAVSLPAPATPVAVGVDEYRQIAYLVTPSGIEFLSVKDGTPLPAVPLPGLDGASVVATSPLGRGPFALGLSDGRVVPVEVKFTVAFPEGKRTIAPEVVAGEPVKVDPEGRPIRRLAHAVAKDGPITAALVGPRDLVLVTVQETKALIGPSTKAETRRALSLPVEGEITALAQDGRGESLFVGTSSGQVVTVDLRDPGDPKVAGSVPVPGRRGMSVMGFLIGDRTLVVADTAGGVSSWQLLRGDGDARRLTKISEFAPHAEPVVAFAPSRRDKGFITADASGTVQLHYGTTGKTLLTLKAEGDRLAAVTYAPKADGLIVAGAAGRVSQWTLDNPHPEVTWKSLFGKVWYEGYAEPEYVWQSTGGTNDFEAKLSLTPLIYGTLKGTCYALLFAIPLALLGALYASQFMHPTLKGIVKPTVEIMAAL